jgi:D-glycero-D-manno-heptose 1,7-bisphosphate phosphatase
MRSRGRGRRAVFVDRDGVVNSYVHGYVVRRDQLSVLPGAVEAVAALARTQFLVVLVTNQSAINRGLVSADGVEQLHRLLVAQLEAAGGRIDAVYYCPHRPDEGCGCRKPSPGMLHQAGKDLGIDLQDSFLIGDDVSDLAAARAAGCTGILVSGGRTPAEECRNVADRSGCRVFDGIQSAVEWIIQESVT